MINTIIFDFDGTIINTNELIREGLQYFSHRTNQKHLSSEELNNLYGRPLEEQMRFISIEKEQTLTEQFRIWYQHHHNAKAFAFPGVIQTIKQLHASGIRLAILTNNATETTISGLKHLGILEYFEEIVSRDDVSETKPSPEGMYLLLETLGISKEQALFIGDTGNDVLAAKNAGVKSGLVGWRVVNVPHQPDYHIQLPEDILRIAEVYSSEIA